MSDDSLICVITRELHPLCSLLVTRCSLPSDRLIQFFYFKFKNKTARYISAVPKQGSSGVTGSVRVSQKNEQRTIKQVIFWPCATASRSGAERCQLLIFSKAYAKDYRDSLDNTLSSIGAVSNFIKHVWTNAKEQDFETKGDLHQWVCDNMEVSNPNIILCSHIFCYQGCWLVNHQK